MPNATLFIHFSGTGGTSVVDFARSLRRWHVPSKEAVHGVNANIGCASGRLASWARAYGVVAGAGVSVERGHRCPCSALQDTAKKYTFIGAENPVMVALDCVQVEYWAVLRPPVDRILSRVFKPSKGQGFRFLSFDEVKRALNSTVHFNRSGVHEFTSSSALNNWYVRSLCGPSVYELPLGAVNDQHLAVAKAQLDRLDIVLPMSNLTQLPNLLSRQWGVCVKRDMKHKTAGSSTSASAWHTAERNKALSDEGFMAALIKHNLLDMALHEHAQQLFAHKMGTLKDPCNTGGARDGEA